jgi:Flp pilus assembly protein TadG
MNARTVHDRTRRILHREEGQATFEFLLILPFFFLFFLLMVDVGLMTYSYISVANATREGARFASVNCGDGGCTETEIVDRVIERSGGILDSGDAGSVTVAWGDATGDGAVSGRGDAVTVSVDWPYSFLFFPASIDVVACADMRLEQSDGTSGLPGGGAGCD